MDRHDDLVVALTPLIDVLERLGVAWYVGGSVASTVHGRFRATNDVDVIAELREEHAGPLRAALAADHYVDEESIRDAVQHESSFNLVHYGTGLKIDVFVAGDSNTKPSCAPDAYRSRSAMAWARVDSGSPPRKTRSLRSSRGIGAEEARRNGSGPTYGSNRAAWRDARCEIPAPVGCGARSRRSTRGGAHGTSRARVAAACGSASLCLLVAAICSRKSDPNGHPVVAVPPEFPHHVGHDVQVAHRLEEARKP